MKILIVGAGGREHALAWKIAQSPAVKKIYCAPGNAGTADIAENVAIAADKTQELLDFALKEQIDLTVVGPEQPLVAGITDLFEENGLRVFGPSAKAARIEGSKVFSKNLMLKYKIPTAEYHIFDDPAEAKEYLNSKGRIIVKADGLAAGKGAFVCQTRQEARDAIATIMEEKAFGEAGSRVVIEEFLEGPELSFLALTDGKTVLPLDSAQDHKAAFDGDRGPNTGGMGAYSPTPLLTPELRERIMAEIMEPTLAAMNAEGCAYRGILYAGLMLTERGPKVLEFNARLGDPETQPLLMRLKSDWVPLMQACIDGTLDQHSLEWNPKTAVCVVMASGGYPGSYAKGKPIKGLEEANGMDDVVVFHAGTKRQEGQVVTDGGRVLGVTALGDTLNKAIDNAYGAVGKINWDNAQYRTDIGKKALSC